MKLFSPFRRLCTPGNLTFLVTAALLIVLFFSCFGIIRVSGDSMDPTLADGQFLVGLRINLPFIELHRGDVVTLRDPNTNKLIIKRIIALPGDRIELAGGQLYLNGEMLHEPYIYEPMNDTPYSTIEELTVPEGQFYVLGDNRNISHDSRSFGCVEKKLIHSMFPLYHQVIVAAAAVCSIAFVSWFADNCAIYLERRWAAYVEAKKVHDTAQSPAESEHTQEDA